MSASSIAVEQERARGQERERVRVRAGEGRGSLGSGSGPAELVKDELRAISRSLVDLVSSDLPQLSASAEYWFRAAGKLFRPTVLLLVALAAGGGRGGRRRLLDSQVALAKITEMIHTASLLHDDVLDESDTRRGVGSVNHASGNKLAILGGDFLLARASLGLALLRNCYVVEVVAQVIEDLVRGEVLQLSEARRRAAAEGGGGGRLGAAEVREGRGALFDGFDLPSLEMLSLALTEGGETVTSAEFRAFEVYVHKSYLKTASMIANACKAEAVLGGHGRVVQDACFRYGLHLGVAFQLVDDILDFKGSEESLGKPAMADLRSGLATGPLLFALQHDGPALCASPDGDGGDGGVGGVGAREDESLPANVRSELQAVLDRGLEKAQNVERAAFLVRCTDGLDRSKDLARRHASAAREQISALGPASVYADALHELCRRALSRSR